MPKQRNLQFFTRCIHSNCFRRITCSDPQHELDKVFFAAEVLARYRSCPSQYTIGDGFIRCHKDGWILNSLYITSNNEVYCYLYDLSLLPNKEQRYWKIYNLKSRLGKEDRLEIKRNFFCSFDDGPLSNLLRILQNFQTLRFGKDSLQIWNHTLSIEEMINEIAMPLIEEDKHYKDQFLLPLARLIIEGFSQANLKWLAEELDIDSSAEKLGSLSLLEKCLIALSDKDQASIAIAPLRHLQDEKSSRSSHGGKSPKQNIVKEAKQILSNVTKSLDSIATIINTSFLCRK